MAKGTEEEKHTHALTPKINYISTSSEAKEEGKKIYVIALISRMNIEKIINNNRTKRDIEGNTKRIRFEREAKIHLEH